jgi:lipid A ethanolaminephosphotransferase
MALAPKEQVEIPFIVWSSEGTESIKQLEEVGQYHTFHSVLDFLGIESEIYNPELTVFK